MVKYFVLLSLLFFLEGCNSAKVFYSYGDFLISWQVDNYFDLTNEQEVWVEEKIISHLDWHRKKELPNYKIFLVEIQEFARNGLVMKDLDMSFSNIEKKRNSIFERITPDIALFLTKLSADQINYFENKLLEKNTELKDNIENDHDRLKERKKYFIEQMEDWFGELSKKQILKLSELQDQWYKDTAYRSKERMEFRLKSQKQFLTILRTYPGKIKLEKWLRNWTRSWVTNSDPKRKKRIIRNKKRILEVDKILTPEQRLYAIGELDSWIDIIEDTIENYEGY